MTPRIAALNTLVASRWTIFLARLFGRRIEERDGDAWVIMAEWKGRLYLIEVVVDPCPEKELTNG